MYACLSIIISAFENTFLWKLLKCNRVCIFLINKNLNRIEELKFDLTFLVTYVRSMGKLMLTKHERRSLVIKRR